MSIGVYTKTAGDLIREALRDSNIVGAEMPIGTTEFSHAESKLNDLLAHWQAQGIHLWSHTEAIMPMNPNQTKYVVGTDHIFTDYQFTTVTTAASLGATALVVGSTSGMTNGDHIGVQLSDGTRQWTTLTIVDGTHLTLGAALTASVAVDAEVYTYTTGIDVPVRVLDSRFGYFKTDFEIPMRQQSRKEYFDQPNKLAQGAANLWYYDRQLSNSALYVWPVAYICTNVMRFTFIKPQYIPEDQSEDVLIPAEWYLPLKWSLASDIALSNGVDANRQQMIDAKSQQSLQEALNNDVEIEAWSIQPDNR